MALVSKQINHFDDYCIAEEQIPRVFSVSFRELEQDALRRVQVVFNGNNQLGDIINDNAYQNDFYRYHDIFHYSDRKSVV